MTSQKEINWNKTTTKGLLTALTHKNISQKRKVTKQERKFTINKPQTHQSKAKKAMTVKKKTDFDFSKGIRA